jgi:uncharacterized protein
MVHPNTIRAYAWRIAREFKPERIILFGSYASGTPTSDSDVDLLVIMRHTDNNTEQAVKIHLRVAPPFPMDLLVRRPRDVRDRLHMDDYFIRDIVEQGRVLYEGRDARVDR